MKSYLGALKSGQRLAGLVFLLGGLLPSLPFPAWSSQSVVLAWSPSSDPTVVGYRVRYGLNSGNYTKMLDVGNQTSATITGLTEGQTYYFVATSYNFLGLESVPSNEAAYTVPGFTLVVRNADINDPLHACHVSAIGATPARWTLESSVDLKTWTSFVSGSNQVQVAVPTTGASARFFRLKGN